MIGSIVGLTFVPAGPAEAVNGTIPALPVTCSPGQPKLDYNGAGYWSNVCGFGEWNWDSHGGTIPLVEIRMPTTPYHRVWLHGTDGEAYCLYSQDTDVTPPNGGGVSYNWTFPANVQVSNNTAPC
jgi:hypothetical protein